MYRRFQASILVVALALCVTPAVVQAATNTGFKLNSAARASRSVASLSVASASSTEAKMEAQRHSLVGSRVATFSAGEYAGRNVIIIQVEAFNDFLLQKKYQGKEISPNLNKLIGQSWYWPNAYSETGMGNTADAEFTVNSSLLAPYDQACAVKYANRVVPGLPRILGKGGYDTFTIHGNKASYWNRAQLYAALGFNRYYDRVNEFAGVPLMGDKGPSDAELFKHGTKILESETTTFYAQFITLSAHTPFDQIPEADRPVRTPKELAGSLMGKYISAESYSDYCIGQFIKNLKADGLWDNSIVVIYGDHSAMLSNSLTGKNALGAKRLLGRSYSITDRQKVGLIVHLPGQTAGILRRDVAGECDVMPTVCDALGVDLTNVPHVGRSLFIGSSSLVPLTGWMPPYTFVNNRVLLTPKSSGTKATAYWVGTGAKTSIKGSETTDLARSKQLRKLSDSWLMSLPTFNAGKKGWIPDPVARKAAKKYGFAQG